MSIGQKRGRFHCIFIDFSKAFDSVELLNSLRRKGVTSNYMALLVSVYCQLCSCVKFNN